MVLRVLSYNIRHGWGSDDVIDLSRTISTIAETDSDIVCLQEVDKGLPRTSLMFQARLIAEKLGLHFCFCANYGRPEAGMGNAIFSRFPIYSTWNTPLPFTGEPRGLLGAQTITPDGPVELYCTHWGLTSGQRNRQAASCVSALSHNDDYKIVCGDLNGQFSSEAVQHLLLNGKLNDAGPEDGKTFTSNLPISKIDYVLMSPGLNVISAEILQSEASDHLPLLVTFEYLP